MRDKDMIIGISDPNRCTKDLVWWYVIQNEFSRLSKCNGDEKSGKEIDAILKNRRDQEDWLDWELALDEFWKDESEKDYRSYIIIK